MKVKGSFEMKVVEEMWSAEETKIREGERKACYFNFKRNDVALRFFYGVSIIFNSIFFLCRAKVVQSLESSGKVVIDITLAQVNEFCGNCLELRGDPSASPTRKRSGKGKARGAVKCAKEKSILACSTRAFNAFTEPQKALILENIDQIVHAPIDTIEKIGGGGVRCMLGTKEYIYIYIYIYILQKKY